MPTLPPGDASSSAVVSGQDDAPRGGTYSFDVAVTSAGLSADGRRTLDPRWVRAVVAAESLTEAHLLAAQMVGTRGMVVEVLLRE